MADAKIEIKVGSVSFMGEGSEAWLTSQLDNMLKHLPELVNVAPAEPTENREEHKKPLRHKEQRAATLIPTTWIQSLCCPSATGSWASLCASTTV
jgi:hypothetical protein